MDALRICSMSLGNKSLNSSWYSVFKVSVDETDLFSFLSLFLSASQASTTALWLFSKTLLSLSVNKVGRFSSSLILGSERLSF